MRGVVLGSILLVAACTPVRTPHEVGINDPRATDDPSDSTSTGSSSTKPKAEAESWGSSETASASHSGSSSGSSDTPTKSTPAAAESPPVPAALGGPSYDRAALEVALKRVARQVKSNCGGATNDEGVVGGPWGKTTFTVKLGHNGHSKGGTIPAPYDGKPTGNCVVKAFTNVIYAPFAGDDTDVDWPVEIVKP